jgi:hypothetical protein
MLNIKINIASAAKRQQTWKEKKEKPLGKIENGHGFQLRNDLANDDFDYFISEVQDIVYDEGREEKQANSLLKEEVRTFVPMLNPSFDMVSVAKDLAFRQANVERINEITGGGSSVQLYPGSERTLLEFESSFNEILSRNNATCECILL